ncbi:MAG: substrate-binding domain-containing protein [Spirochaetales bacterium]|nr:substrate-binding domain-containing protein [Spirochaetales bacterium]
MKPLTLGLFVGSPDDPYMRRVIDGVVEVTAPGGHKVVCFASTEIRVKPEQRSYQAVVFDLVDNNGLDGLIISGSLSHGVDAEEFAAFCRQFSPLPVVTTSVKVEGIPGVFTDSEEGLRQIVRHLITAHGFRRLGFLGGPPGQQEAEARKSAFCAELRLNGCEVEESLFEYGDFTYSSGVSAARRLSAVWDRCERLVCANDLMALGAKQVLAEQGKKVPEDFVLTGFDDFQASDLTTVSQPVAAQSHAAAELLLKLCAHETVPQFTNINPQLVIRTSCSCRAEIRQNHLVKSLEDSKFEQALQAWLDERLGQGSAEEGAQFLRDLESSVMGEANTEELSLNMARLLRLQQKLAKSDPERHNKTSDILGRAYFLLAEAANGHLSRQAFDADLRAQRVRQINETLLSAQNLDEIAETMAKILPNIGFDSCWLSLWENPRHLKGPARLLLEWTKGGRSVLPEEGVEFMASKLIPGGTDRVKDRLLFVEVLYSREPQGFVVFSANSAGSLLLDAVRSQISAAIERVRLWEERMQTETQMIQSEKMAALGSLVAGVAHEINTPVGIGVTTASDLHQHTRDVLKAFENNQLTKTQFHQYLSLIEEEARLIEINLLKAGDLIRSFKKIAVDQSHEEARRFEVGPYIKDIVLSLHSQWKVGGHRCEVECPESLALKGPPGTLAQILGNLISNAVFHGFEGRNGGLIKIVVWESPHGLRLEFSDNGQGIPPEYLDRIFEPFFTTKFGRGGSGLGLHIVYNLVTQIWKGTISCVSAPGQGTKFIVDFPAQDLTEVPGEKLVETHKIP